jgi:hypothetical protein
MPIMVLLQLANLGGWQHEIAVHMAIRRTRPSPPKEARHLRYRFWGIGCQRVEGLQGCIGSLNTWVLSMCRPYIEAFKVNCMDT